MFRTMVIAGVGLIGGSLALAARERGLVERVVGYGRNETTLRRGKRIGILDRYFLHARDFPEDTDFLVLATPVSAIAPLTRSFLPRLDRNCLISDVGSVKGRVVADMDRLLKAGPPFVGAHPIAGSDQWGPDAARADLFVRRRCIITPTAKSAPAAVKKLRTFWRRVGAKVETMDAGVHDRVLGVVSHLPHVAASALVNALERTKVGSLDLAEYCGSGFRDTTRIAAGRPELWRDICLLNREAVLKGLREYARGIERFAEYVRRNDGPGLEREFERALATRKRIT
ncbi:MAG: prephenate dehydrogenase/arogenate dehydrogenase family protein [Deltaproteobacteria bacterium]|nr:prephenate dehydrogenase/arogenate dehydrogenase family protein [Deltaproteobacteria bacterium]